MMLPPESCFSQTVHDALVVYIKEAIHLILQ